MNPFRAPRFLVAFVVLFSSTTFAQSDGLTPGQRRLQRGYYDRVGWHLVNGVWMRASGSCEWNELLQLSWRDQHLLVEANLSDRTSKLLRGGRTVAVEIGLAKDLYQISAPDLPPGALIRVPGRRELVPLRSGQRAVYLTATELPETDRLESPRRLRPTMLVATNDLLRVTAEGDVNGTPVSITFVSQGPAGAQLSVSEIGKPQSELNFSISAASLEELHVENRAKVRRFLSPLLRVLMGHDSLDLLSPGAADVYAVFSEIIPPSSIVERVQEILPRMSDPNSDARTDALAELRKLGAPGVCAISRLPRDNLSAQQIVYVEQILKENSRHVELIADAAQIGKLRVDPHFLIDCLEFADPAVRAAALQSLRGVLGRPIEVDPVDARASARIAVELRGQIR